jgi:hypothetical protein
LKAVREKTSNIQKQTHHSRFLFYKVKITADFSTESLKAREARSKVFWALDKNNFNSWIFY